MCRKCAKERQKFFILCEQGKKHNRRWILPHLLRNQPGFALNFQELEEHGARKKEAAPPAAGKFSSNEKGRFIGPSEWASRPNADRFWFVKRRRFQPCWGVLDSPIQAKNRAERKKPPARFRIPILCPQAWERRQFSRGAARRFCGAFGGELPWSGPALFPALCPALICCQSSPVAGLPVPACIMPACLQKSHFADYT